MKNIIKALGILGGVAIMFATSYFSKIYVDLTQLIVSLGIVGIMILAGFLYIYNWIQNKDEEGNDRDEAMDRLNMYIREVEEKIK